jgi:RimJ/RimL family protein N-acetyltransferase
MGSNLWQAAHIRLRGVEAADWKVFMEWNLDTEAARSSYFIPFPQSSSDVQRYAEETARQRGENDVFNWAIDEVEHGLVGVINSHDADRRNGTFSYGVAVRREFWGRGYAGEAICLVLNYFFNELGYQKCNVGVYAFNQASIRLHEKLGFLREGRQRRSVYTAGRYYDNLLYGMTAEEFRARWPQESQSLTAE